MSLFLALTMVFSLGTTAFAANYSNVTPSESLQNNIYEVTTYANSSGLYWGPVTIGDIQLKITEPHSHPFGKFRYPVEHINLHIEKIKSNGKLKPIANYHIAKYIQNQKTCIYVYDSVSRTTLIDRCDMDWKDTVKSLVKSVSSVVSKVSSEGNWIAKAAIWGTVTVVLIDLLVPMDPIPIIPFSTTDKTFEPLRNHI